MRIVLAHGGAGTVEPSLLENELSDLRKAVKAGYLELFNEISIKDNNIKNDYKIKNVLNAVQKTVLIMEDSPYFNAGYGSSLTSSGTVENDAIICDGSNLNFGAVCSVTKIKNPIILARSILEESEHCVFSGDGAHQYAKDHCIPFIDNQTLIHQFAKDRLTKHQTFINTVHSDQVFISQPFSSNITDHDTVGAVAMDHDKITAAATSTGGITGKQLGRVGDTPIIGSGAYSDNRLGTVSTTGHGEAIMKVCLARDVLIRYERNLECNRSNPMQLAVDESLENMRDRVNGFGGIIAVGVAGHIGIGFSTHHMPWAYVCDEDNVTANHNMPSNDGKVNIHYGYKRAQHSIVRE